MNELSLADLNKLYAAKKSNDITEIIKKYYIQTIIKP